MTLKEQLRKLREEMAEEHEAQRRRGPTQVKEQLADYNLGLESPQHPFQIVGPMGGRNPTVPIR